MTERLQIHRPRHEEVVRYDVIQAQEAVEQWISRLYNAVPELNRRLIEKVPITVGENSILHRLGRAPRGVEVVLDDARPVYVYAYDNSAQTLTASSTTTRIWGNLWPNDTDGNWGGHYNKTTGEFTCPHTGIYHFEHLTMIDTLADGQRFNAFVRVDGANWMLGEIKSVGAADNTTIGGNHITRFEKNEVLDVMITNGGVVQDTNATGANNWLSIRSDDSLNQGTHTSTHINIWSARERTMSFRVW